MRRIAVFFYQRNETRRPAPEPMNILILIFAALTALPVYSSIKNG